MKTLHAITTFLICIAAHSLVNAEDCKLIETQDIYSFIGEYAQLKETYPASSDFSCANDNEFPDCGNRLIVRSDQDFDFMDAEAVLFGYDDTYILQYGTYTSMYTAYELYKNMDMEVIPDVALSLAETTSSSADYNIGEITWGADFIGADVYNDYLIDKYGDVSSMPNISVAVLDSGADLSHPLLDGRVDTERAYNVLSPENPPDDDNSNGTHVTGIICDSTLPNVQIIPIKIADSNGDISSMSLISGLELAADYNVDIINLSLSGIDTNLGLKKFFQPYMDELTDRGSVIVVAAGNEKKDVRFFSPANCDNVISVSACNSDGSFAFGYSNFGDKIEICAPGTNVKSSIPGAEYGTKRGTSMACPYVASACAMLLTNEPDLSPDDVLFTVCSAADDKGERGHDSLYGYGILNMRNMINQEDIPFSVIIQEKTDSIDALIGNIQSLKTAGSDKISLILAGKKEGILNFVDLKEIDISEKLTKVTYDISGIADCDSYSIHTFGDVSSLGPLILKYNKHFNYEK